MNIYTNGKTFKYEQIINYIKQNIMHVWLETVFEEKQQIDEKEKSELIEGNISYRKLQSNSLLKLAILKLQTMQKHYGGGG